MPHSTAIDGQRIGSLNFYGKTEHAFITDHQPVPYILSRTQPEVVVEMVRRSASMR
jgi:hypothetical protein